MEVEAHIGRPGLVADPSGPQGFEKWSGVGLMGVVILVVVLILAAAAAESGFYGGINSKGSRLLPVCLGCGSGVCGPQLVSPLGEKFSLARLVISIWTVFSAFSHESPIFLDALGAAERDHGRAGLLTPGCPWDRIK